MGTPRSAQAGFLSPFELAKAWRDEQPGKFAAGGGRIGVFLDYDVPDGEMIVLNLDSWTVCEVSPMGWLEDVREGSLFRRPDKITYQASMVWFTNLLCLAPGANGRLTQKTG